MYKDLEIVFLRYQLGIVDRNVNQTIRPNSVEKLTLSVLVNQLKSTTNRSVNELQSSLRLFSPRTVFRWHNELVKHKWTYSHQNKGGRPKLCQDIQVLVIRLAIVNPRWGYGKIEGELLKLGIKVSQTTIRNILNRLGIVPTPVRAGSIGWRHLMSHYKNQLMTGDFLTVEMLFLKTLSIFFFIDIGTRRVHIAGITEHPNSYWVAQ